MQNHDDDQGSCTTRLYGQCVWFPLQWNSWTGRNFTIYLKKHCTTLLSKNDLSLIFLCFALYHEFFPSIRLGDRLVSRPISLIIEPLTTQWQRENSYWLLHCHSCLFVFQILLTRLCLRLRFERLRFFVFGFVSSLTLWFPRSLPYHKQVHKETFKLQYHDKKNKQAKNKHSYENES